MKPVVALLLLLVALLAVMVGAMVVHPYYAHRLAAFAGSDHLGYRSTVHAETMRFVNRVRLDQQPARIGFFGASTIERLDVRGFGADAMNLAYGGSTARDVLQYWQDDPRLVRMERVVLLVGFNDLASGRSVDRIAADMTQLLTMRKGHGPIMLTGVLPVAPQRLSGPAVSNAQIAELNLRLANICAMYAACRYIDPQDRAHGFAAPLASQYDAGDGLHLNAAGNRRLARLIDAGLRAVD